MDKQLYFTRLFVMRRVERNRRRDKNKNIKNNSDLTKQVKLEPFFLEEISKKANKKFPWKDVIIWQTLSSELIDLLDNNNKIDWKLASKWQVLSENQIKEHKDKVSWKNVILYQKVSSEFLHEHVNYLPRFVQKKLKDENGENESLIGNI